MCFESFRGTNNYQPPENLIKFIEQTKSNHVIDANSSKLIFENLDKYNLNFSSSTEGDEHLIYLITMATCNADINYMKYYFKIILKIKQFISNELKINLSKFETFDMKELYIQFISQQPWSPDNDLIFDEIKDEKIINELSDEYLKFIYDECFSDSNEFIYLINYLSNLNKNYGKDENDENDENDEKDEKDEPMNIPLFFSLKN